VIVGGVSDPGGVLVTLGGVTDLEGVSVIPAGCQ
jgi:hypothetical protein